MHRRQLLASSVLAPFVLAACGSPGSEATSTSDAMGFSYTPDGYDGVTIELDHPAERIATDFDDNSTFKSLLPVKHNQLGTWGDKRACTDDGYTQWLGELADLLENAQDMRKG